MSPADGTARRARLRAGRLLAPVGLAALAVVALLVTGTTTPRAALAETEHGRLYRAAGYRVLELVGTPEEMGRAHGLLLGEEIRSVIRDVLAPGEETGTWAGIEAAVRVMDRHQPERFRREMRALAEAAGVDYMHVVALQLFGDARRGMRAGSSAWDEAVPVDEDLANCTTYAVFGPATATGEMIVGRNFDYFNIRVARYASIIIHYRPEGKHSFVTLTWSGVVNGWTLVNDSGLCAANNTAFHLSDSLEGISTCFLGRLIVENAPTVEIGVEIARRGPRSCGTAMLLAGRSTGAPTAGEAGRGETWTAVELEFDHDDFVVREATDGYVLASNGFRHLGRRRPLRDVADGTRYGTLLGLIRENHGRINRAMNFAAARGVPIANINLHSALVFPSDQTLAVAMGSVPACEGPYRLLRVTEEGIREAGR